MKNSIKHQLIDFIATLIAILTILGMVLCIFYIGKFIFDKVTGNPTTFFKNDIYCWLFFSSLYLQVQVFIFCPYFTYLKKQFKNIKKEYGIP